MNNSTNDTKRCFFLDSDSLLFNELVFYLLVSVVSAVTCLVPVVLVCVLKLHKTLVYRLALYQVLSALEFSILWIASATLQFWLLQIFGSCSEGVILTGIVFGALLLGSMLIKLMFTVWIVIHLFALAVFHKNLQKLEPLYVASSLLIPLIVTAVLLAVGLVTEPHHLISSSIQDIMYTITFAVLTLMSLPLLVVMLTVLCYRACRRRSFVVSEYDKQHKKALCEMLPLILYPILFLLLTIPIFGFSVRDLIYSGLSASFVFTICAPIWSLSTSLFFIIHLCVVRRLRKQGLLRMKNPALRKTGLSVTTNENTHDQSYQNSATHFSALTEE